MLKSFCKVFICLNLFFLEISFCKASLNLELGLHTHISNLWSTVVNKSCQSSFEINVKILSLKLILILIEIIHYTPTDFFIFPYWSDSDEAERLRIIIYFNFGVAIQVSKVWS